MKRFLILLTAVVFANVSIAASLHKSQAEIEKVAKAESRKFTKELSLNTEQSLTAYNLLVEYFTEEDGILDQFAKDKNQAEKDKAIADLQKKVKDEFVKVLNAEQVEKLNAYLEKNK